MNPIADIDVAGRGEDLPLLEGIRTTRAIRRLKPDPVPRELIRKVCEAGTFAPSGGNRQPWFFVAVTEPERRTWVATRYRRAFAAYIQPAIEAARDPKYPEAKRRNLQSAVYLAQHLHDVPVHLFVAGWTRRGQPQAQALFPAIQNILLACRAVGLGASLTTMHLTFGRELDEWLGIAPGLSDLRAATDRLAARQVWATGAPQCRWLSVLRALRRAAGETTD